MATLFQHVTFAGLFLACTGSFATESSLLHAGPMQGYPAMRSAEIWLQTQQIADTSIVWWPEGQPQHKQRSNTVLTNANSQFTAHFSIAKLDPGNRYQYQVLINGHAADSHVYAFRTMPLWQWRGPAPDFKVLTGSCAYINEDAFDRPGKPYGGGYEIYQAMANQQADLMLWMGDNLYFREADYASPSGMAARYWHDRALPELQPLLQNTPQVAIWDDHDYGYNDSGSSFIFKQTSLNLFKNYWANPSYGLPETPGTFTKVSMNDADFFMLDDRWWRDANNQPEDDPHKQMFGQQQMRWLENALLESTARFKIIVAGGQMLNNGDNFEGWNHFPTEQHAFLDWLAQTHTKGILFLSGDRHITELLKLERGKDYPLYEFTCSPLNSSPAKGEIDNPQRIAGTLVETRNFCRMDFTGQDTDRLLTLRVFDSRGNPLWQHQLTGKDLGYN